PAPPRPPPPRPAGAPPCPPGGVARATPDTQPKSLPSGAGTRPSDEGVVCEKMYSMLVSGSNDPPGPFEPPPADGRSNRPSGPSALLTTGGEKNGRIL